MIRFIACDIDGTMLQNGDTAVPERLLANIRKLVDRGIVFAPASGRQYPTMKRMFGDVANELMYICENGALVVYKGKVLSESIMDRETVMDIVDDILSMPACEVLLSGRDISYIKPKTEAYFRRIHDRIKNNICLPNDFRKLNDDFIKVAACDTSGVVNSKDHFMEKWSDKVQTVVSGELYMDFTNKGVNKGNALLTVLDRLGISTDDAMAFGDSYNDAEMLKAVKYSYAMADAETAVKKCAAYTTENLSSILERIIRGDFDE